MLASTPDSLPSDLRAAANIIRSYSLCELRREAEASALLDNTERLAIPSTRLTSELQYTRASCVFSEDRSRAEGDLQKAATLVHGIDGYLEARAIIFRGYLLMQDGHYDQAIDFFNQALIVTDSPLLKEAALGNIGYSHERLGEWEAAPVYLQKAESLAATMKDAKGDQVLWLLDLGEQYFSQLQYSDAEKTWLRALEMERNLNDQRLQAMSLNNLGLLALIKGDRNTAGRYIDEGKRLNPPEQQQLDLLLTEAKLAKLNNNPQRAEDLLLRILASKPDDLARYNTQTELATLYSELGRNAEAEKLFREAISTAEGAFSLVQSEQGRISFMDQEPFYDRYINFLVGQNRVVDALNIAERGRSRALAVGLKIADKGLDRKLDLPAIQRGLAKNQAVLAYWLSWTTESYLWLVTPSEVKLFKLAPEKQIDDAVDAYSDEVTEAGSAKDSRLGEKLYEMLVAPAEKYLPEGSQVLIVPHRRLYKLNFETLVAPHPTPHYWIEDVCIQNASFLAMLEHHSQAQPHYAKDLLLMGAPVQASKDFPGLAHAPEEIAKIATHFPRSKETVIEGAPATPAAYDSSGPGQYRFFHFVTHGTASETNPLDSAIILSPSSEGYKLYARDIIKTQIHPELVTISACYGAGTRQYSGEGLVGLAWAFMRVGAHYVVAALWEVDDAATANLMDQFYTELKEGKSEAKALRDAKLAMLHSPGPYKRPFYWASLQLQTGP